MGYMDMRYICRSMLKDKRLDISLCHIKDRAQQLYQRDLAQQLR